MIRVDRVGLIGVALVRFGREAKCAGAEVDAVELRGPAIQDRLKPKGEEARWAEGRVRWRWPRPVPSAMPMGLVVKWRIQSPMIFSSSSLSLMNPDLREEISGDIDRLRRRAARGRGWGHAEIYTSGVYQKEIMIRLGVARDPPCDC